MVLGVAATVSEVLDVDPVVTRVCFVVLALAGGWGVVAYLVIWAAFVFVADPSSWSHRVAARRGLDASPEPTRDLGVGVVTLGLVLQARIIGVGFVDALVWPAAIIALGLAVAWRRVGDVEAAGWLESESKTVRIGILRVSTRVLRLIGGATVVLLGSVSLLGSELTVGTWLRTMSGLAVMLAGVVVMFSPTLRALAAALVDERQRRIRADERAVISSHLHDSVLQTLALIQKRVADPAEVAALARQQERELREWLYDKRRPEEATLQSALTAATAEVEAAYRVPIECIVVGDAVLDERVTALIAAAREAMVNASKFSMAPVVDVYGEVSSERIELFVRDRGIGFDPSAVAADRRGVAESIVGRLERIGGTAEIRSASGEGVEVRLCIEREVAR